MVHKKRFAQECGVQSCCPFPPPPDTSQNTLPHTSGWSPQDAELQELLHLVHQLHDMGVQVLASQKVGSPLLSTLSLQRTLP